MRLMIVDDSIASRHKLKKILVAAGHEIVCELGDGEGAVESVSEHVPDLVFMDLIMPKVDGKTALKNILSKHKSAKVVVVSSLGNEQEIEECLELGASGFVQKPLTIECLRKVDTSL